MEPLDDEELRAAALAYVRAVSDRSGGHVTRAELETFVFEGRRVRLIAPQQGIWWIKGSDAALSIVTAYARRPDMRPYDDRLGPDGYPRYKWRGTDPGIADNVALRRAMALGKPLLWFVGIAPGVFTPIAPCGSWTRNRTSTSSS